MSIVSWERTTRALRGDVRLDGVGVDLIVGDGLVAFEEELSITGAPVVRVGVVDPDRALVRSGLLDLHSDDEERLGREVELVVDGVAYWLRGVSKDGDLFELTFEDRTACRLRDMSGAMKTSAGAGRERAFVKKLCELAEVPAPVVREPGPDEQRARARSGVGRTRTSVTRARRARVERRERAIADGARLRVKGQAITPAQVAEANTLLGVADDLDAPRVAREALVFAAIAESTLGKAAGTFSAGAGHYGVLMGSSRTWPDPHDTAGMARCFLLGGRGFQGGGAIALARTVTDPETIALRVEAPESSDSYKRMSSYDTFLPEARAIVDEFGGGSESSGVTTRRVTRTTESPLTVEKGESYWDAAVRIADSYRFRFFVVSNRPYFLADEALMQSEKLMTIGAETPGVSVLDWEWAPRKPLRTVSLDCAVRAWTAPPGSVVMLDETCGPAGSDDDDRHRGRWLVGEYRRSRLGDVAQVTLVKGRKPVVPTQTTTETYTERDKPEQGSVRRGGAGGDGAITTDGGAKGIVEQAAAIALRHAPRARVSSDLRPGDSGDHGANDAGRAARDIAIAGVNPLGPSDPQIPELNEAAVAVAAAFGKTYGLGDRIHIQGSELVYKGYRVQVFWRTYTPENHYNHIHVGALKL